MSAQLSYMHTDTLPLNGFHAGCEPVLFTAMQRKARAKDAINVDEFLRKFLRKVGGGMGRQKLQWGSCSVAFLCIFCKRG